MLYKSLLLISSALFSLNHAFNCCITHGEEAGCAAVADNACTWLVPGDPLLTSGTSAGNQCVSVSWAECERTGVCSPPPAVPLPPPAVSQCVFETCTSNAVRFNIAILIDESGSVGTKDYLTSLDFVENFIRNDINDISKISLLSFSSGVDRIYHFSDSQNDQRAGALAALNTERSDYNGGLTATATVLRESISEFEAETESYEENLIILMTDGHPNTGGDPCDELTRLNNAGIDVYIVGVSDGFNKEKLECLVPDDKIGKRILTIPKFQPEMFWAMEAKLRQVVCPIVFYDEEDLIVNMAKMMFGDYGYYNGEFQLFVPSMTLIVCALVGISYWKKESLCNKKDNGYESVLEMETV